jgi:prepilin-type processing-associated H-X9-DG protein
MIPTALAARGYHPGGVNALLMDGSSRFFSNSVSLALWRALGTRQGGKPITE